MKFIVSRKNNENGMLLVVTDADILGKKFEENKVQLDLTKKFYQGQEKNEAEVQEAIKEARHLHLTGIAAVTIGINLGLINKENVIYVKKIPHAEVCIDF